MTKQKDQLCPLITGNHPYKRCCQRSECAWWCADDEVCAVKKISIELIRIEENLGGRNGI